MPGYDHQMGAHLVAEVIRSGGKDGMEPVTYRPIGIIHTPFTEIESTPINGIFARDEHGNVEVFPEYTAGLRDVEGFSHLILIYHLHRSDGYSLIAKPFLDNEKRGVFAIRHFRRPNPIGISIVKLDRVENSILHIREVDMLDGTPLLDIKPYIAIFDSKPNARNGWADSDRLKGITEKKWEALRNDNFEW